MVNQNSHFSEDEIYYYVEDLLLNNKGGDGHRVKSVRIHTIKPIGKTQFDIEFSVEIYWGYDNFIPDKGRWVSSHMRLDVSDIEVRRDIKINNLLKNPEI